MVTKVHKDHVVGRICGVTTEDSKIQAAEKAIKVMRDAGFPVSAIRKAERMVEDARARGVK